MAIRRETLEILILLASLAELEEQGDVHSHKCAAQGCGTIWTHRRPPMTATEEEYHAAHNCPKCGRNERMPFDGDV
jgi:hypothetical protein